LSSEVGTWTAAQKRQASSTKYPITASLSSYTVSLGWS